MAQLTIIKPNGQIVISRDSLLFYPYGGFLTNGNAFYSIFSDLEGCQQRLQPFDITQKKPSYFDRAGIVLRSNGNCTLSPLWDHILETQLECDDGVFHGWTDDNHFIALQFTDGNHALEHEC
ncbi:hypothetical protein DLAC_03677 [Tieghemostelium lacteum]|uniref:Uncharacterized protein n=1 Tax=Tieghemostelium lacteum TaxID=361077 RepID=A0A152A0G9_TIELA|nr:hypothetical protein DLAC_03677 [Tieghemostelium lacteum]|eukprot:KYQ99737.1 hypothetical protein DLAC_03677 [Tieghemostelium lacteum]